jgi:hypothetical protein
MFFVSDSETHKRNRIEKFLAREPMIAVLLAAANFEWTVGRCVLFFGSAPNVDVRNALERTHGLKKYENLWRREICQRDPSAPLLSKVIKDWQRFTDAFQMRHRLIHGRGTCTTKVARDIVAVMLAAVADLYRFAEARGRNLNVRTPIRQRPNVS